MTLLARNLPNLKRFCSYREEALKQMRESRQGDHAVIVRIGTLGVAAQPYQPGSKKLGLTRFQKIVRISPVSIGYACGHTIWRDVTDEIQKGKRNYPAKGIGNSKNWLHAKRCFN